jgi:hypothetical protein
MRWIRRAAIAVVIAAVLAPAGAGAADAAPVRGPVPQCDRPLSARTGNWFCPVPGPDVVGAVRGLAAPQVPGYCNSSGCYKRYDDFRADFESTRGAWGYGPRLLGYEEHGVTWQLTGARTTAKPVFYRNSVDTVDVTFSGDLLNAAPGRPGDPVGDAYSPYYAGAVQAGVQARWRPNGYTFLDRDNFDHVQVTQFSWSLPGYPGYWFSYVKSLNATSPGKDIYRFRGVDQLPADPFGGGYRT